MNPSVLAEIKKMSLSFYKDAQIRLYGSRYKNTAKSNSDIDILIISEDNNYYKQLKLIHTLKESEIPYEIDIQVVSEGDIIKSNTLKNILENSKLL